MICMREQYMVPLSLHAATAVSRLSGSILVRVRVRVRVRVKVS